MAPPAALQLAASHCLTAALAAAAVCRLRSRKDPDGPTDEPASPPISALSRPLNSLNLGTDDVEPSCSDAEGFLQMEDDLEDDAIPAFSDWASSELLGCQRHADCPEDLRHGEIREALRTIAGLYLRADVPRIRDVIESYHLADILTQYLVAQYQQSPTLTALGLQISQAFAADAFRRREVQRAPPASPPLGASPPREAAGALAGRVHGWVNGVASAPANDVEPLEGVATADLQSDRGSVHGSELSLDAVQLARGSRSLDSSRRVPLGASPRDSAGEHGDGPSLMHAERSLGRATLSDPAANRHTLDLHSLRSFGSRTILSYLMQELEALLTSYLSRNWHRMDGVLDANELDLREDGLICLPSSSSRAFSGGMSHASSSTSLSAKTGGSALTSSDSADSDSSGMPPHVAAPLRRLFSDVRARKATAAAKRARRNWQRAFQAYLKCMAVKTLRPKREFKTMAQLLHELCKPQAQRPADRDPIFLFLGGGMAAGKSTVREIIGSNNFWSQVGKEAVVIEADAIKNQDVVFQELQGSRAFAGDSSLSQFVHEYSTRRASGMLVAAVNAQKDIIFDGTCSWEPFVRQTVAMLRDHEHDYELGPGYVVREDGDTCESYWRRRKPAAQEDAFSPRTPSRGSSEDDAGGGGGGRRGSSAHALSRKRPYRVELVGVTCDPTLAVARGFWRKIRSGRAVPVSAQLRSHRMFSANWPAYCKLLDSATLYHTGTDLTTINKEPTPPRVIAHKSRATRGELLVHPQAYKEFQQQAHLHEDAGAATELYPCGSVCTHKFLKCPKQLASRMNELRAALGYAHEERQRERERRRVKAGLTRKTTGMPVPEPRKGAAGM